MSKTHNFDAVIFDLDGVITKTALVHSVAWTRMFNDYLRYREEKYGENHREFTHEKDYLPHVDGKPRYKGVDDFLRSRNITIPFGDPSDPPEKETACGLGNRKNDYFTEILNTEGVEQYDSTVELIKDLKREGIRIGVASSSKNCKMVLETAGLEHYFETRVDGIVSAELGLKGKPEPDIFTTACDNLGVAYDRSVVVEDAVSGVQAGAAGGFGFTLGVAREGNVEELRKNGADIVVEDISELGGIERIDRWFGEELDERKWSLRYPNYIPEREKTREALLATGNGFFATRGSMEEVSAGEHNYPGSYMTGLYNRRKTKIEDKWIENEDFVNFINWLPVSFRPVGEEWFDPRTVGFSSFERVLNLKTGLLTRKLVVDHAGGKKTLVESRRFVSMADHGMAGLEYSLTPLNYSSKLEIYSMIDGNLQNKGVERYNDLDQNHLDQVDQGRMQDLAYVVVRTNQSDITIAVAEKLRLMKKGERVAESDFSTGTGTVKTFFKVEAGEGEKIILQKMVRIENSRDFEVHNPLGAATDHLSKAAGFEETFTDSKRRWEEIWRNSDLLVRGDRFSQMLLRLHIYHLMVTASPVHKKLDAGIPARGLHGEAYRGHIFWDELYVLPFFVGHYPEIARSVLMYRYRRLDKARDYARQHGYKGAMFPWQSGSNGREETQVIHLNPVSGEWGDDYSSLQRHISIAIAYNIWEYYHISNDQHFMDQYGAEMFLEICRFWSSKTELEERTGRYTIRHVMGPDEFHEKYPGSDEGGLNDNAYTNLMVVWCMKRAFDIIDSLSDEEKKRVTDKIGLRQDELENWQDISKKMKVVINEDDIIAQFDGYFELKELKWDDYRKKYDDIHRLDRILKAEGKSPDEYKAAKQADTLMLFYVLNPSEVKEMLSELSYPVPEDLLKKNFDYYIERTSHGSTLSRVVHAFLAELTGDRQLSWDLYMEALASDYTDIQGGTTAEGIHAGVMGGTILSAINMFGGLNWRNDILHLDPDLPDQWNEMEFKFLFREDLYHFHISRKGIRISVECKNEKEAHIMVAGKKHVLKHREESSISL